MNLLENINDIKLDDDNKYHLESTLADYKNYINDINNILSNNSEYKNNLSYNNKEINNAINCLCDIVDKQELLTKEDLITVHNCLTKKNDSFRKKDSIFVGSFSIKGLKIIDYVPINSSEIESSVTELLNFLNNNNEDNPFLKPFIFHAILSIMQPFDNGNTRTAKVFQHVKIHELTNKLNDFKLEKPVIFLFDNYLITKGQYRYLLKELANNGDNELWNKWFKYNLYMADEQIYYNSEAIKKVKK